jgi:hypothetical protein
MAIGNRWGNAQYSPGFFERQPGKVSQFDEFHLDMIFLVQPGQRFVKRQHDVRGLACHCSVVHNCDFASSPRTLRWPIAGCCESAFR